MLIKLNHDRPNCKNNNQELPSNQYSCAATDTEGIDRSNPNPVQRSKAADHTLNNPNCRTRTDAVQPKYSRVVNPFQITGLKARFQFQQGRI